RITSPARTCPAVDTHPRTLWVLTSSPGPLGPVVHTPCSSPRTALFLPRKRCHDNGRDHQRQPRPPPGLLITHRLGKSTEHRGPDRITREELGGDHSGRAPHRPCSHRGQQPPATPPGGPARPEDPPHHPGRTQNRHERPRLHTRHPQGRGGEQRQMRVDGRHPHPQEQGEEHQPHHPGTLR